MPTSIALGKDKSNTTMIQPFKIISLPIINNKQKVIPPRKKAK